jgi:choline-sulfatase
LSGAPGAVLFLSDEHNARVAGPYGHPRVETPVLDRLAAAGTVYDSCYCPSPLCLPSRSALMGGRRVHELQTYSNCNLGLPRPAPLSYGRVLADAGVHAAYVGKTDVYAPAAELGFTETILGGDRALPGDRNHRRNPMAIRPGGADRADGYGPAEDAFDGDLRKVDAAVAWLRDTAPGLDRPWLLVLNTSKPHFPHRVTPELWERYADAADLPAHGIDAASAQHPHAQNLRAHFETEQFSEEQVRGLRRGYYGCVSFVDEQLGRVLDAVDEAGLSDVTQTVYASDHGEMLGTFGMWWKCTLYEESARVPCIAAGPGFDAGVRASTPVDLHDVRAGLMKHLGVDQPADWVGAPLHELPRDDAERVVFSEYHGHGATGSAFMVRRGRHKLMHHAGETGVAACQLFDLQADPDELDDRSAREPERVAEMLDRLRRICDPAAENARAEVFIEDQLRRIDESDSTP